VNTRPIYVLKPDVTRETQEKIATRLEEVVGREGGKLTQVETGVAVNSRTPWRSIAAASTST